MGSPLAERLIARPHPVRKPTLDPIDEGVDHGGLHLRAELLARFDRRLELIPADEVLAHASIVRAPVGARNLIRFSRRRNAVALIGDVMLRRAPGAQEDSADHGAAGRKERPDQERSVVAAGKRFEL
jgi:hypothetical protein